MTFGAYIRGIFSDMPEAARNVAILGGGALRSFYDGTTAKDYDLFFRSHQDYLLALASFLLHGTTFEEREAPTGTAQFYDPRTGRLFNLIGFYFDTPKGHIEAFDFRCCMLAAWLERGVPHLTAHPQAVTDAQSKTVVVMNNNGEERTLKRVVRYQDYGYRIHTDDTPDGHVPSYEAIMRIIKQFPRSTRGYG